MLLSLLQGLGILYYWTWFIWPFIFMFSTFYGLSELIKNKELPGKIVLLSSISLVMILAGITAPFFKM